jgi:hypothetical protein
MFGWFKSREKKEMEYQARILTDYTFDIDKSIETLGCKMLELIENERNDWRSSEDYTDEYYSAEGYHDSRNVIYELINHESKCEVQWQEYKEKTGVFYKGHIEIRGEEFLLNHHWLKEIKKTWENVNLSTEKGKRQEILKSWGCL